MSKNNNPDWDEVLSAASRLQRILPEAILVGGTASAIHAKHRFSHDADHVLVNLRTYFDDILALLESVAGWKTARIQRPILILGSLDGIETGVRQLIRSEPLETTTIEFRNETITLPTEAEILRIKGMLILKRNAARDYIDFVALAHRMGDVCIAEALKPFDQLYPQTNGESALQQLQIQLANPMPFDLDPEMDLSQYKGLDSYWHDWKTVLATSIHVSILILERV